jgi:hypothetical protein
MALNSIGSSRRRRHPDLESLKTFMLQEIEDSWGSPIKADRGAKLTATLTFENAGTMRPHLTFTT